MFGVRLDTGHKGLVWSNKRVAALQSKMQVALLDVKAAFTSVSHKATDKAMEQAGMTICSFAGDNGGFCRVPAAAATPGTIVAESHAGAIDSSMLRGKGGRAEENRCGRLCEIPKETYERAA